MILDYKGINVFYTDQGKGETVVLLHGFLENSKMWQPFMPSLAKNYRVISIDLLGHGETACLGYIHSMELMAEAVNVVLKHLKIKRSIFICHSMGGYVALAFAEKKPEGVLGLCLANSTAKEDSKERKQNRDRAINVVKQNHKSFIQIAILNLFRPKNRTLFFDKIQIVKEEALKMPLQGIIAALEGMKIRPNREHLLQNSAYKKLMIISKKDPVLNYNELIIEAQNAGVKVAEFPDGHMSYIENESIFLLKIMHFIENI